MDGKFKRILSVLSVLLVTVIFLSGCGVGNTRVKNDSAEKDRKGRYLTVINNTKQVINEVHINVGAGTEVENGYQKNPDEQSFSIEIPKEYNQYSDFTVILIDRYGMKYEKEIKDVPAEGRTEVEFSESDYVKQDGDFKKKIDKWFNGD